MLAAAPATASYMQYVAPAVDAGTEEASILSKPLWAVGFSGLSVAFPGGLSADGSGAPGIDITGRIVFVNDQSDTNDLALDCPS